ncbi:MAG: hypothetical protein MI861_20395 [Pirellulales bacterium]|nr:hypothetical protein [Pirellulales bacterium]
MATNGEILGMLVGILIFVVGYTALDYGTREFSFRSNRRIRTTLKVTYGTRIIISILFPVGAYLDLVCGLITVSLVGALTGVELGPGDTTRTGLTFFSTILATLIQGCVLNVVLAFYAVAVHGVQWFFGLFRR